MLALSDSVTGIATSFDESVRDAVHSAAFPALTVFFSAETWLGSSLLLIPVCAVVALWLRQSRAGFLIFAAFAGAYALTEITKVLVRRPRPVAFVGHSPETWSFPSGHALESAAVYWTVAAIIASRGRRVTACLIAVLPLITGLSRIYLGMHYPTDVLAGWAAGACWSAGLVAATRVE
jgi:undecaprenyl-diphosphatase